MNTKIYDMISKWFMYNDIVFEDTLSRNVSYSDIRLALDNNILTFDGDVYYITDLGKELRSGAIKTDEEIGQFVVAQARAQLEKEKIKKENENEKLQAERQKVVYSIMGARGRYIDVYENKCIITTKVSIGSVLTGNATDGEKTIYYADCIGVQFKKSGLALGYLQLETAGAIMNNRSNNFFNENTFTFDGDNERMEEVYEYVKEKVEECKNIKNNPASASTTVSAAEEIKKFKELFDLGIITQEEFDAKKKQLLGL